MHRPHQIIQVALLAAFVSIIASACGGAAAIVTPAATGAIATPYRAVVDGATWVSVDGTPAAPGYLARLSSEPDAVDLALSPGPGFGGSGDLVVAGGSAWVIDGGNDRVLRLPLAGFRPTDRVRSDRAAGNVMTPSGSFRHPCRSAAAHQGGTRCVACAHSCYRSDWQRPWPG